MYYHGLLGVTEDDGFIICPGDWIITDKDGDQFSYHPDEFKQIYEAIEE